MLPTVIKRVLAMNASADQYFEDLITLAEEDPTFAVRLIRIANAPWSAPSKPIVTVRQAVVRIGAGECAALATALAVTRVFVPETAAHRNLWVHSLQCAVAARTIAGLLPGREVIADHAYLMGLLHDIGRFVMCQGAAKDFKGIEEIHWGTPQEMLDAERALLGFDHVQLGVIVCRRWSLPDGFADLIGLHHDYNLPRSLPKMVNTNLIRIVQMADLLSTLLMERPQTASLDPAAIAEEVARVCVRPEWPRPPVSAYALASKVVTIRGEAAALVDSLLDP